MERIPPRQAPEGSKDKYDHEQALARHQLVREQKRAELRPALRNMFCPASNTLFFPGHSPAFRDKRNRAQVKEEVKPSRYAVRK